MQGDPDGQVMGSGLFASLLAFGSVSEVLTVYNVVIAVDADQALLPLAERIGPSLARQVDVGRLNPHEAVLPMPLSTGMVGHLLRLAADRGSPLAYGLELYVEHRTGR